MSGRGEYSAEEWHNIAANLQRSLGPEYLAQRPGPSGTKLTYIEGKTAINIANDIFGFNGWSTDIKDTTIDFVDIDKDQRVSVGVSVTVRVTLKDGSYHEDVGYGHDQNAKSKGTAFEKARKQAVTDATKRTLRFFGNALGNCLYDNPYLSGIGKMAKPTIKFTPTNLYRHSQFEQNKQQQAQVPASAQVQQPTSVPQIQYQGNGKQAAATANNNAKSTTYQPPKQLPQVKTTAFQASKPSPPKMNPTLPPTKATSSSSSSTAAVASNSSTSIQIPEAEAVVVEHDYTSPALMEPIIPEDSFSYEGDDEFFAQLAAIDEGDPSHAKEEILPIDLSITSSPNKSSSSAPSSQNGNVNKRESLLSDLDKKGTNKRTCVRN